MIDITHTTYSKGDYANGDDITEAVSAIMNNCALGNKNVGGLIGDVGTCYLGIFAFNLHLCCLTRNPSNVFE